MPRRDPNRHHFRDRADAVFVAPSSPARPVVLRYEKPVGPSPDDPSVNIEPGGRDPRVHPVHGDALAMDGEVRVVDQLKTDGVLLEDGRLEPWASWREFAASTRVVRLGREPCPNRGGNGTGHMGRVVCIRQVGRCIRECRCLACSRVFEIDSSD